jgi:DnaJ family protein B protein 6
MSSNLYEELGISRDAPPEQSLSPLLVHYLTSAHYLYPLAVRKAYKKRALQTHPDRLPAGATPEEKTASEEMFRRVCQNSLEENPLLTKVNRSTTPMKS